MRNELLKLLGHHLCSVRVHRRLVTRIWVADVLCRRRAEW